MIVAGNTEATSLAVVAIVVCIDRRKSITIRVSAWHFESGFGVVVCINFLEDVGVGGEDPEAVFIAACVDILKCVEVRGINVKTKKVVICVNRRDGIIAG